MLRIRYLALMLTVFAALGLVACGGSSSRCKEGQTAGVFVTALPSSVVADGSTTITLKATARDSSCNPLESGSSVTFTLSAPSVEGVGQFSNQSTSITVPIGMIYAETRVVSSVQGTVTVIGTIPDLSLSSDPVVLTFTEPPQSGYCSISMAAVPPSVIANGTTSTTITATLQGDDNSVIPDNTEVVFTTSRGAFSNSSQTITVGTDAGQASTVLTSEKVDQNTTVNVTASAVCNDADGTLLLGDLTVQFLASQPTIVLTPSLTTLQADGTSTTSVVAAVSQSDGSSVGAGVSVTFTTSLGLFATGGTSYTTSTDAFGNATVSFVGGLEGGTATIQATATVGTDSAQGETTITLLGLNRVEVQADANEVYADDSSTVGLTAVVTLNDGSQAWQGMNVVFTTTKGSFVGASGLGTTLSTVTDATGRASASLLGGEEGALAEINVKAIVQSKEVSADPVSISIIGLDQVSLSAASTEMLADGVSQLAMEASVELSDGSAAWQSLAVVFSTDLGSFLESGNSSYVTQTNALGKAQATFVAGTTGGVANVLALASVGNNEAQANVQITLKALDDMNLVSSNAKLLADGVSESNLIATVLLNDNTPIGSGTEVDFTTNLGTFKESGTASYTGTTDILGQAHATLVAGLTGGTATVQSSASVQAQTVEDQTTVGIHALDSIAFVSTEHLKLGIRGSGRNETTRIVFRVNNSLGEPILAGVPVAFTLSTAQGSPTIDPTEMLTNDAGNVWTTLRSGNAVTNVTVTAKAYIPDPTDPVNNPPVSTAEAASPVLSIVGAKPNAGYTSFSCKLGESNQPGFLCDGLNVDCTVGLADRNSNKIGLETRVTFMIEAGSITGDSVTSEAENDLGRATVIASANATSPYQPKDTTPLTNPVEPSWSDGSHTYNPRDGLVAIIAVTTGEEAFNDLNANGEYDAGEPFVDENGNCKYDDGETFTDEDDDQVYDQGEPFIDLGEPFIDANDNGQHDQGEVWKDSNNDGQYQGPNCVWDNDTEIWTQTWIVWTHGIYFGSLDPDGFFVPLDSIEHLIYSFSDINLNPINAISTSTDAKLFCDIGTLEKELSSPELPDPLMDDLGTAIHMRKVSDVETLAPCCEIIEEPDCPDLDRVCFLVPEVTGFSSGWSGSVALKGEDIDTQEPSQSASVQVTVSYRKCPGGAEFKTTVSASGTMEGCTPNCGGKQCGDDGCGGECGTCQPGETCNTSGQCEI